MEKVISSADYESNQLAQALVSTLDGAAEEFEWSNSNAILYYGFPKFHGYEEGGEFADILFLSKTHGLVAVKIYQAEDEIHSDVEAQLDEIYSLLFSRFFESRKLRRGSRRNANLKFNLESVALVAKNHHVENSDIIKTDESQILQHIRDCEGKIPLSDEEFNDCRAVLEGTKSLGLVCGKERRSSDTESKAYVLTKLEEEIKTFDHKQRASAIGIIRGPQRIRGLAGSGKTVVLAMKAAHIHLQEPESKILFTFFTKSLYEHVKNLITQFYRHYSKRDPDWNNLHIRHAWGGKGINGVYYSACSLNGINTTSFDEAKQANPSNPFDYVCQVAVESGRNFNAMYDYALLDEAQDMPRNFFRLIYKITKGELDQKNIIWGYDELQNIFKVKTRSPKELFGEDGDGNSLIDLDRAAKQLPEFLENDIVLKRCYRNPREVLLAAHALGFGMYRNDGMPVQTLEDEHHWEDVGYQVESGKIEIGQEIVVFRSEKNSPLSINRYVDSQDVIESYLATSMTDESEWASRQIVHFIEAGLNPQDILVIALDDRAARDYFSTIKDALTHHHIKANNVLLNPYNSKSFIVEDQVTLSTIHRAKGNEAAVVIVIGIDGLYGLRGSRYARNKIFTAFTRAKVWLRVSGCSTGAKYFLEELKRAQADFPKLRFTQPDPEEIQYIERDFSESQKKLKQLKQQFQEQLDMLNIPEEQKKQFFEGD